MVGLRLPGYPELRWSLLLALWLLVIEFGIMRQFKPGTGSAGKVTMLVLITIAMLCVTAYFFGFLKITIDLVVPLAWIICLMVSIILFVAAVIFRGREVAAEFQRRFHV